MKKKKQQMLGNLEIAAFCDQLSMIVSAGIPIYEGISILQEDAPEEETAEILSVISNSLDHGSSFCDALRETNVFPKYVLDMIGIGELAGKLEEVLNALTGYYKREESIQNSIKNAVTYPLLMIAMMLAVILVLIAQIFNRNFENVFLCVLTLFLFGVPNMVQHRLDIELPNTLEIIILLFIYAAEILGEINAYYVTFPYWDTVLHTLNGFLCAAVGFSLLDILNREEKIGFSLSPLYLAIVAFCFSMTVGVIWEFFECTMDQLFLLDMQKDTVVNTIGSVMLDPTGGNNPGVIRNITDVIVVQSDGTRTALGLGLDIGLLDTMEDLFVNFIGAFTFSIIGYFYVRSRGKNKFAKRFIPVVNEEPQPQTKNTSAEDAPETKKTKE